MSIAIIVHGGAGNIPDEEIDLYIAGCRAALAAGWSLLQGGASALDACEAAVRIMEDDPIFDAGTGSVLTSLGTVELDAAVMDGRTLRYGSVANLRHVRNPVSLARRVLEGPATFLAGAGAEEFATSHGLEFCANSDLIVPREYELWQRRHSGQQSAALNHGHDTVGAIAIDAAGNLVAANSTGGTFFKLPGRIGDTPLVGCGLYADARVGGAVCTGWGEAITRLALARRAVELLERGMDPQAAADLAIRTLANSADDGQGGCILLSPDGRIGVARNTPYMAYAACVEGGDPIWGC